MPNGKRQRAHVKHPVLREFDYMVEAVYDPETKTAGVMLRQVQDEQTLIVNCDRREGCVFISLDSFPALQQALREQGRAARQMGQGGPIIVRPS